MDCGPDNEFERPPIVPPDTDGPIDHATTSARVSSCITAQLMPWLRRDEGRRDRVAWQHRDRDRILVDVEAKIGGSDNR